MLGRKTSLHRPLVVFNMLRIITLLLLDGRYVLMVSVLSLDRLIERTKDQDGRRWA
jgi:hypothetical protein